MKALVAALERIATALEQLVPALQQATREQHMARQQGPNVYAYDTEPVIVEDGRR